ncbi:Glycine cleavage system H protein [Sulfuracidifex tepidarius]|uniref:Probable glycine cleavage system H protein n=1 Tax=Sulfuracidifex tepidarius TaxID=1294262 RepID=A0A510DTZ6_9CREN|nr:glycine cleavage system protein H [Sulfuracidifex tepidarius]BBG23518.1 Glycine cleavage system H protein [Sulfuracidifex tepidarius]
MKVGNFSFPDDLLYDTEKHVWIKVEGNVVTVGITDIGQYIAGKIFQVTVKEVNEKVNPRSNLFTLESAKWIGKFRLPLDGEVIDTNKEVVDDPSKINKDPYSAWIVKVKVSNPEQVKSKFKDIKASLPDFEREASRLVREASSA